MIQIFMIGFIISFMSGVVCSQQLDYQPKQSSIHHYPEVPRITAFEAKELYDQGKLILANAHNSEEFARKHIVGSISFPNDKPEFVKNIKLPPNFIIAFYCE